MLAYNTTAPPSFPPTIQKKFAGLLRVLLVGQFTRGMCGLEGFVDGVQGGNRVAKLQAAFQRVHSGGGESPVQFGCYVAGFHLPALGARCMSTHECDMDALRCSGEFIF